MKLFKRYVSVEILVARDGTITPLALYWEDGIRYEIEKILEAPKQRASVVGGCGILYVCQIQNQRRNLYFEQNKRWFIESLKP